MAKIIDFYIPDSFHKEVTWIPAEQRGQLTEFRPVVKLPDPKDPFSSGRWSTNGVEAAPMFAQ
jgi:hypothetical protein